MTELVNFKLQSFIDCIEELVRADETERALWLSSNLPAFYRDNPPKEIVELRREIMSRIATPYEYAKWDNESDIDTLNPEGYENLLRAQLLIKEVNLCFAVTPYVIDVGPGSLFAHHVLKNNGRVFRYHPIGLGDKNIKKLASQSPHYVDTVPDNAFKIFFAGEIIEHLWNEDELRIYACKFGLPDVLHISTPKYTHDYTCNNWRDKRAIGHLRAYTPREFVDRVSKMFPEYDYAFYDAQIMQMRLVLKGHRFLKNENILEI